MLRECKRLQISIVWVKIKKNVFEIVSGFCSRWKGFLQLPVVQFFVAGGSMIQWETMLNINM